MSTASATTLREAATSCPACDSSHASLWSQAKDHEFCSTADETFSYYQCDNCETIFIDPMPLDRLSTIYPSNYYSFLDKPSSFAHKIKDALDQRFFKSVLAAVPGDSLRVLDIGGGTGWLLETVRAVDSRVVETQVVDIDSEAEKKARANGHQYFCGRIEEFETEKKFDLVLLLNLIEHVADPRAILEKISSLLSDSGVVIVKTPNIDSLDARIFRESYWGGLHCPRHWVLFSDRSIVPLIERTGLKVKSMKLTQGAPFWTWSVLIWLARKGIVRIDKSRSVMQHPLHNILQAVFAGFDFARGLFCKTSQMMLVLEKGKK